MDVPAGFDAQRAVRMQAEELDEYMRELFSWSKDMKMKRAQGGQRRQAQAVPAAEAALAAAVPVSAATTSDTQQHAPVSKLTRHPAAHTYEHYRSKWDTFDVDAAMAAAEEDEGVGSSGAGGGFRQHRPCSSGSSSGRGGSSSSSSRSSSAPMDIPQARVTVRVAATGTTAVPAPGVAAPTNAEGWKEAGNTHFKAGRFSQAVACYSRSLEMQPGCLAYANRAMAHLKLGSWAAAEADCSHALLLDPLYVKAYQRRASARHKQGNLLGGVEDCEWVLRLESNNRQAAADRSKWVAVLLSQRGLSPPSQFTTLPVTAASAAAAAAEAAQVVAAGAAGAADVEQVLFKPASVQPPPPQQPQQPKPATQAVVPLAGIQVVASTSAGEDEAVPDLIEPQQIEEPQQQGQAQGEQQRGKAQDGSDETQQKCLQLQQAQQVPLQQVQQAQTQLPAPLEQQQYEPASPQHPVGEEAQQQVVSDAPAAAGAGVQPVASIAAAAQDAGLAPMPAKGRENQPVQAAGPAAVPALSLPQAPLKVPRTGVEFEKGWRGLKGDRQRQAAYLLTLQPSSLPVLLKQALTPALLVAAAAALLRPGLAEQPAAAVALLAALPGVPRFDLNLLSVPPRQRAELGKDWDAGAAGLASAAAAGESGATALAEQLAAARQRWKL